MSRTLITFTSLVMILKLSHGVVITPGSTDPFATVAMTTDTRANPVYVNGIVDGKFQLDDEVYPNQLGDWNLILELAAIEYGFKAGQVSTLTISIDGNKLLPECDVYFAFSFGDEKYLTFVVDLDNGYDVNWNIISTKRLGIFIYPGDQLATGDPSTLYQGITYTASSAGDQQRQTFAGGDYTQWALFTATQNGNNFPLVFTFTNDDSAGTLSLTFNGVTRTYNEPAPINKNFKLYAGVDVNLQPAKPESMQISSFTITGTNTGYTLAPTSSPTLDGCDFDIDAYLSQCYCTDISSAAGSPFNGLEHDNMNKHYGGYDNNDYGGYNRYPPASNPNPSSPVYYPVSEPNNGNFVAYLSIILNFALFGYMFYINGCNPRRRGESKSRYSKVRNYESEQNAINA